MMSLCWEKEAREARAKAVMMMSLLPRVETLMTTGLNQIKQETRNLAEEEEELELELKDDDFLLPCLLLFFVKTPTT